MEESLLSSLKYIFIFTKFCGLQPYTIKLNNEVYISRKSKTDIIWLILVLLIGTYTSFATINFRLTTKDDMSNHECWLFLIIYHGFYIFFILNIFLHCNRRKKFLDILLIMKQLERQMNEFNVKVKYRKVKNFSLKTLTVQFLVSIFFLVTQFMRKSIVFYIGFVINLIFPMAIDNQLVSFVYVLNIYASQVNDNLKLLRIKIVGRSHSDLSIIINKSMDMFKELHELSIEVNKYYYLIVLRLCLVLSVTVSGVYWTVVLIQKNSVDVVRILCILAWIATISMGIFLVLYTCDLLTREVSDLCLC